MILNNSIAFIGYKFRQLAPSQRKEYIRTVSSAYSASLLGETLARILLPGALERKLI